MHKLRKKPSLNRITYRNFSMRNITNSSKMLDDDNDNNENGNKRFTTPKIKVCSKKNKNKIINLINTIDCNNNNNYLTTTTSLHKKNKVVNINSNTQSAKKHSNVYSHIYSHKGKLNTSRSPFLRNKI